MNTFSKGKIALAVASLLATPFANAADKLSVSGFLDMSYYYEDADGSSSSSDFGIDQFEVQLGYQLDSKLSAHVDLEVHDNGATDGSGEAKGQEFHLEQAYINYALTDAFSVKAGRFLSYSGWETEDPTGLYQYSGTGYGKYFYGAYQQGVSGLYSSDKFSAAVSVVSSLGTLEGEDTDFKEPAVETMLAYMPTDEITIKAFYSVDKLSGTDETTKLFNLWGAYSKGPLTLALEYNQADNSAFEGSEADGYLAMANYAFSDKLGLTLRYHAWDVDTSAGESFEEASGFTISPSYTVSDNLLMVFEVRMDEVNDEDVTSAAVEALITF